MIVDDEPLARRSLKALLKPHPEFELVGECGSGRQAVELVNSQPVDLMFLDIQMPEMDGFGVVERLDTEHVPVIVFVTAYDQFAVKAFEVSAADYLPKPVEQARFEQCLRRARRLLEAGSAGTVSRQLAALLAARDGQPAFVKRLLVRSGTRITFVAVEDIDYIEANDYYAALHVGPKVHLLRESMEQLEERLDPARFVRIHRSAIVNVDRILELRSQPSGAYSVHLRGGAALRVSRSRSRRLHEVLGGS